MTDDSLVLRNRLKEIRKEQKLSQGELAKMVGVSRNTISSIETGQFSPTAKLALILCIALDKKFEDIFYFDLDMTAYTGCLLRFGRYQYISTVFFVHIFQYQPMEKHMRIWYNYLLNRTRSSQARRKL